jgi:nucleoside-diphosphate-sugar epimerase
MGRRALVIGARGFIGAHLSRVLVDQGWLVSSVSRSRGGPGWLTGHVLDESWLKTTLRETPWDGIVSLTGVQREAGEGDLGRSVVTAASNLVESVAEICPKTPLVLLGSSAEYGPGDRDRAITEDGPVAPATPYGVCKLEATRLAALAGTSGRLSVKVVRPFNVVGPGAPEHLIWGKIAERIREIREDRSAPVLTLGSLESYRDLVDVRDVARGIASALDSGASGSVFNLCSGAPVQMRAAVAEMVRISGLEIQIQEEGRGIDPVPFQKGSFEKARKELGWKPVIDWKTSLRDLLSEKRES